ncbi:MAG: rod shape-determining protein RodA [Candidatus Omnitrophica bacterium]|nr:rod shape-determining protein RodA [Candidatus Omnitrophota bacterium]
MFFRYGNWKNFDFILLAVTLVIFAIGLSFLFSASYQQYDAEEGLTLHSLVVKQIIRFALAFFIAIIILKVDYQKWLELAYPLYLLNVILLAMVLLLGQTRLGAQRWISLGFIGFQPSEFSKLIVIFTLARYLGQKENALGNNLFWRKGLKYSKTLVVSFLIVGAPFILIVKQPDLGTALTLIPILLAMLYVWGTSIKTLLLVSLPCVVASPFLWHMLKPYQKRRVLVFLDPNIDPLGAGYTVIQSKIAIGSGGLLGKGWLAGTQNQLNFLPERHTDFIFSVVGEEWGFLGAALLLTLYMVLILKGFSIAQRTLNTSGRLLACGIVVLFAFQVVVNIAMTIGLVPVVGLPLPLISYGGSSLFLNIASIAFLLNVGMKRAVF